MDGEEIVCTAEHPFYVVGKGFVPARELNEGDNLISSDGVQVKTDFLKIEYLQFSETTYNFEVEDFHTYYVSKNYFLTHNKCWEWGKGSYHTSEDSLRDHALRHAEKLGLNPKDIVAYLKKATNFADTVVQRGVKASKYVEGFTVNIRRYVYLGKYIDMDKINKVIVSFGVI